MGVSRFRAVAVALFLAALAALILSVGAGAVNSQKPYSIVICGSGQIGCTPTNPAVFAPGATASTPATMSVTFTNKNQGSGIQLGSDNLTVPNPACTATITTDCFSVINTQPLQPTDPGFIQQCPTPLPQQGNPCFYVLDSSLNPVPTNGTGPTIGFRNLNLAPGAPPVTFRFLITTPTLPTPPQPPTLCTTTNRCRWSDQSKQSNDFSGTGNGLNADSTSAYDSVTSAVASCPKKQACSTELANGATGTSATSAPGSIDVTVSTTSGRTAVTQVEAIDFGTPFDPRNCSGVFSPHLTFENMSNGTDNGSDRSQTITIKTTDFKSTDFPHDPPFPDYAAQACLETGNQFTQLILSNGQPSALAPATQTGPTTFQGLLPDCAASPPQPLQVNCNKTPGVLLRQTSLDGSTHTLKVAIPPGFDMRITN